MTWKLFHTKIVSLHKLLLQVCGLVSHLSLLHLHVAAASSQCVV